MNSDYTLLGEAGSGSVIVEAALTLLGLPYRLVPPDAPEAAQINPMAQVPALVLPSGEVITESAAILIWLADSHPEARLSPTMASHTRPSFLRWMAFVSSQIYALYWIRDDPSRVVDDEATRALVRQRTAERIASCWAVMDRLIQPGFHLLGDDLTVLDLYVAVVSRWGPRRRRFYEVAPKMTPAVRRVDADPRLQQLWEGRFPFVEGWEG